MDTPLSPLEVRIYLKQGLPYVIPRLALDDTMRQIEHLIARVEHPKQPEAVKTVEAPKATPAKTKASLLGKLLKDNKITAGELIEWIENKAKSIEDIGIVMKGETRKTVKAAASEKINELL